MEFIGRGIEKNDEDGDGGFAPAPGTGIAAGGFADGAPEQGGEDSVFREVSAFANDVVNGFDVGLGHVRKEPVQEGFDQPRGMGVGFRIAGAEKDEGHPREREKPVFQKRTSFRHRDKKLFCENVAK